MAKLEKAYLPSFEDVVLDGPNVRSRIFGDTPLHIMAIWGDVEAAKTLIDEGAEVDARGEDGYTPLHQAISQGKIEVARLLLCCGADPHIHSNLGDAFELADYAQYPELKNVLQKKN